MHLHFSSTDLNRPTYVCVAAVVVYNACGLPSDTINSVAGTYSYEHDIAVTPNVMRREERGEMSVVHRNGIISAGLPNPWWIAVDVAVALVVVLSLMLCCYCSTYAAVSGYV